MAGNNLPPPPRDIDKRDLTTNTNGQKRTANAPVLTPEKSAVRDPATHMRQLGFDPESTLNPLQFLTALFNNDVEALYKDEKKRNQTNSKGGFSLSYRLEAAKTAARYIHMEMPKVSVTDDSGGFGDALQRAMSGGHERVRKRTVIVEEVERISPDIPLDPANYPPAYGINQAPVIDQDGNVLGEDSLNPEGNTEYNADEDVP